MAAAEIVEKVSSYGTSYRITWGKFNEDLGRSFNSREAAEAMATLIRELPDGYRISYRVAPAGSMWATSGWQITGPGAWKSTTTLDLDALTADMRRAIDGQDARIARANAKAAEVATAEAERLVAIQADQIRREMGLATERQVEYIVTLLARRARNGDGGGFFSGPTTIEGIRRLTKDEASTYIDSLTENY